MKRDYTEPKSPLFVEALARGLSVLTAFAHDRPSMNLRQIAEAADVNKSAAQRLTYTLEKLQFLRKDPATKSYSLSPKAIEIGLRYIQSHRVLEAARPYLRDLHIRCGETVNLSEPDGLDMIFIESLPGRKEIAVHLPIGGRYPMFCTAAGRAYLSAQSPQRADKILSQSRLIRFTEETVVDVEHLKEMMEDARRCGFAYALGEFFRSDVNIAAPVLDSDRCSVAAVGVSVPAARYTLEEAYRKLAPLVMDTAQAISSPGRPSSSALSGGR
jgi:IclR family transcriptional regulator, pca regulon regulatory protein